MFHVLSAFIMLPQRKSVCWLGSMCGTLHKCVLAWSEKAWNWMYVMVCLYTYGVWWAWLSAQWSGCFNPFSLPLYTLMGIIPDRGNTMNQQKLNSGMLFVYVYSICAYFHTWGSWWVHFFCVFLCQKQVENCVHTTVESPSLMLIKCEPVYCRNGKYSVILLFVKLNQWFTVLLFNIRT